MLSKYPTTYLDTSSSSHIDQQMEHLQLPIIHDGKRAGINEVIEVESLEANRYRLVCPPAMVEGLAIDDIFELDDNELSGFRVVQHSGFLTIWLALASKEQCSELLESTVLSDAFSTIGGVFNGLAHERFAIFSVPVSAGFPMIEKLCGSLVIMIPESSWQYANVYDWEGYPLGWWLQK